MLDLTVVYANGSPTHPVRSLLRQGDRTRAAGPEGLGAVDRPHRDDLRHDPQFQGAGDGLRRGPAVAAAVAKSATLVLQHETGRAAEWRSFSLLARTAISGDKIVRLPARVAFRRGRGGFPRHNGFALAAAFGEDWEAASKEVKHAKSCRYHSRALVRRTAWRPTHRPRRDGNWVELGCKEVTFLGVDRDVVRVGRSEGRFKAIRLEARGNDVEMLDLKVVYANGEPDDIPVRALIRQGTRTRALDLRGRRARDPADRHGLPEAAQLPGQATSASRASTEGLHTARIFPVSAE